MEPLGVMTLENRMLALLANALIAERRDQMIPDFEEVMRMPVDWEGSREIWEHNCTRCLSIALRVGMQ